jgi:hypothetical protein
MGELGARLVRAREARGLTLDDAERDTRISRRYLQALEAEEFEQIPAPVYARGFLRSYSQYLGLDATKMLELFPRVENGVYYRQPQPPPTRRPTPMRPATTTPPSRPVWRQPVEEADDGPIIGGGPAPMPARSQAAAAPARVPAPPQKKAKQPAPITAPPPRSAVRPGAPTVPVTPQEPTIGIDIGVPARRLQPDPAGGTRSAAILIVAVVAVLGVVLLAFIISRLGDDDGTDPGTSGDASGGGLAPPAALTQAARSSPTAAATSRSGINVTPGVVPDVVGSTATQASQAIRDAGFNVQEVREKHPTAPRGTVFEQAPAAGVQKQGDADRVIIVISEGP